MYLLEACAASGALVFASGLFSGLKRLKDGINTFGLAPSGQFHPLVVLTPSLTEPPEMVFAPPCQTNGQVCKAKIEGVRHLFRPLLITPHVRRKHVKLIQLF